MRTFAINTLGCKVNQYESQQIRQLLEAYDLLPVELSQNPDLVVVNTCCVTHTASAKSRQSIRKAQKQNPSAAIVVAGCLPPGQRHELQDITEETNSNTGNVHIVNQKTDLAPTIDSLLGNQRTTKTKTHNYPETDGSRVNVNPDNAFVSTIRPENPQKIKDKIKLPKSRAENELPKNITPSLTTLKAYNGQCRAFLKIQDGCDAWCSYCIIPKIRTKVCSKDEKTVLAEAQTLAAAGHKEIVLTGIFLGAYGHETTKRKDWGPAKKNCLAKLLGKLAQSIPSTRVRLSSLEPGDVTDELVEVIRRHRNIMPHLHLPLQSGSEKILAKMRRQYNLADFRNAIKELRLQLDRPAITTDVIVGFPGETEDDFAQTMGFAREMRFSKIHVFSYSERKNTAAARMQPVVAPEVIKKRSTEAHRLDKRLQGEFRRQFAGEKVQVLVENISPPQGRCERYFMVDMDDTENEKVKIGEVKSGFLG